DVASGALQAVSANTANQNAIAQIFGNGNGVPPMSTIALINNNSRNGPLRDQNSLNSSGNQDYNADGVACLRSLSTGTDSTGAPLTGMLLPPSNALTPRTPQLLPPPPPRRIPTLPPPA